MQILHGEQVFQSRQTLQTILDEAKNQGREVVRLAAKNLELQDLQHVFGSQSLFGTPQLLLIEELHSLPRSSKKDALIACIAENAGSSSQSNSQALEVVLWEKRDLTPTMLKKVGTATVKHFKASKLIFSLVEKLSPSKTTKPQQLKLLHQAIADESDFFVFTMIIRQIRLLIQVRDGGKIAGPPFMIAKLKNQAQLFSLEKLLAIHQQLVALDLKMKTSSSALTLTQDLDLLLTNM